MINAAEGGGVDGTDKRELRSKKRHPYNARLALVLVDSDGERSRPLLLRSRDISLDGLCVTSRQMIHPGASGAVQLVRSDGSIALVGVTVRYCRYVGKMQHNTGLQFTALPGEWVPEEFLDEEGQMPLLDDELGQGWR